MISNYASILIIQQKLNRYSFLIFKKNCEKNSAFYGHYLYLKFLEVNSVKQYEKAF